MAKRTKQRRRAAAPAPAGTPEFPEVLNLRLPLGARAALAARAGRFVKPSAYARMVLLKHIEETPDPTPPKEP